MLSVYAKTIKWRGDGLLHADGRQRWPQSQPGAGITMLRWKRNRLLPGLW